MKNKKVLIIAIVIVILFAIGFGVYKVYSSYLFNEDGTISDGHTDLINAIKNIEDNQEKIKQINFSVKSNLITVEEANQLYLFNEDGTIPNGHTDLINALKNIEDDEERTRQVNFSVENKLITVEEANQLYQL